MKRLKINVNDLADTLYEREREYVSEKTGEPVARITTDNGRTIAEFGWKRVFETTPEDFFVAVGYLESYIGTVLKPFGFVPVFIKENNV